MKYTECSICNELIPNNNIKKHEKSCNGNKKIKAKEEWYNPKTGKYKCPYCGKEYVKKGIGNHIWKNHTDEGKKHKPFLNKKGWNKGLTKETDERIKQGSINLSKSTKGKKRDPLSDKHKKSISISMKKAHKDNRAWNIGKSRWNNKKSYPEKFFIKIIKNEFNNKNFKIEFPVGIYSCDFAWPDLKKCIEIDGDQHQRFEEYKERDKRKDKFLEKNGWKVLRIVWKDMFKDTKKWIKIAKDFIEK